MKFKEKVISIITENQKHVQMFGVRRLGVFGSVARGEDTNRSDVDLLVEFIPGMKNYDNFINLCFFLEERIGKEVELVTKESVSDLIWPKIEKELEYVEIAS